MLEQGQDAMEHSARVPKDVHSRQGRAQKVQKLIEGWNVPNRRKAWLQIKYKMQFVQELLFQYILNIVWEGEGLEMRLEMSQHQTILKEFVLTLTEDIFMSYLTGSMTLEPTDWLNMGHTEMGEVTYSSRTSHLGL